MQHHCHYTLYCLTNAASQSYCIIDTASVLLYYKCSTTVIASCPASQMQHHSLTVLYVKQPSYCFSSCQTNAASQSCSQNAPTIIIPLCPFHPIIWPPPFSPTHIHLQSFFLQCRRFIEPPADHYKEYGHDLDAHREEEDYKCSIAVIAFLTVLQIQHCSYCIRYCITHAVSKSLHSLLSNKCSIAV